MSDRDDTDPGQEQEWLRESDLINGGLILIGVYLVQPFLTAASLDLPARICVVAFSLAIPLLAALVLVNRRELSRHRASRSRLVVWTRVVAQNLGFVGRGRRVLAHLVDRRHGDAGERAGGSGGPRGRLPGPERRPTPTAQAVRAPGDTDS